MGFAQRCSIEARIADSSIKPYFRFGAGGISSPSARASLSPIAMACLRLVTFFPDRPDVSFPPLNSSMTFLTFCPAFLLYLRVVFFFAVFFFAVVFLRVAILFTHFVVKCAAELLDRTCQ